MKLRYLTASDEKYRMARAVLEKRGLVLTRAMMPLAKIQSLDVEEVARCAAIEALEKLREPVFVTDFGFCIRALHGFPGALTDFWNQCLSPRQILRLMEKEEERRAEVRECLAVAVNENQVLLRSARYPGVLARIPGTSRGTPMERLFVPEGWDKPLSETPRELQLAYWEEGSVWRQAGSLCKEWKRILVRG